MALTKGLQKNNYIIPLIIVGFIFFVIGFGIGISGFLTPALRSAFDLSTGQSYLVTAAIFSAFVIFGRPSAWVITRLGYRKSMVLAFMIMALGMILFVPSARSISFPLFLLALFVGGIGNTLLQASVNPYVTIIGPIDSAAMRMSLMGIMNKMAWWIAPLFLGLFIDLQQVDINHIIMPFFLVAGILFVLGVAVYFAPLPEVVAKGEEVLEDNPETDSSYAKGKTSILQFPHLLIGAVAVFFYIGIEILPMASIIDFARITFGDEPNIERYAKYVTIGLVAGYLFGVFTIPKILSQTRALTIFSVLGVISTLILVFGPVEFAFYGLLLVSFSNSLMWPAIWPLALADLGKFTKVGSSILVMGIVGGAVIPPLYGLMVDASKGVAETASVANYQTAYWIMIPCYIFILYFALHGHKIRR
ncbi:MAG: MFS transporter [Bacteroidetes bacterium]|nr:MAG: MFS transporter [Bacteroidota bacterium]